MRTNSWDTQPARPDESLITDVRTTIERLYRSDSDIQDGELVSEAAPIPTPSRPVFIIATMSSNGTTESVEEESEDFITKLGSAPVR